jgi:superoxide dismutase, Cu-Zn family
MSKAGFMMKRRTLLKYLVTGHVLFLLSACYALQPEEEAPQVAVKIQSASGSQVGGTVTFTPEKWGKVNVSGEISGLTPGSHGFHVHEYGDCSASDGSSAGGHYNPKSKDHGSPEMAMHHAGDLGNIVADNNGVARINTTFDNFKLKGRDSIIGRAVVVHEKADDLTSQPSGAAGKRVGCGVIGFQATK